MSVHRYLARCELVLARCELELAICELEMARCELELARCELESWLDANLFKDVKMETTARIYLVTLNKFNNSSSSGRFKKNTSTFSHI